MPENIAIREINKKIKELNKICKENSDPRVIKSCEEIIQGINNNLESGDIESYDNGFLIPKKLLKDQFCQITELKRNITCFKKEKLEMLSFINKKEKKYINLKKKIGPIKDKIEKSGFLDSHQIHKYYTVIDELILECKMDFFENIDNNSSNSQNSADLFRKNLKKIITSLIIILIVNIILVLFFWNKNRSYLIVPILITSSFYIFIELVTIKIRNIKKDIRLLLKYINDEYNKNLLIKELSIKFDQPLDVLYIRKAIAWNLLNKDFFKISNESIVLEYNTDPIKHPITCKGFMYLPQHSYISMFWKSGIVDFIVSSLSLSSICFMIKNIHLINGWGDLNLLPIGIILGVLLFLYAIYCLMNQFIFYFMSKKQKMRSILRDVLDCYDRLLLNKNTDMLHKNTDMLNKKKVDLFYKAIAWKLIDFDFFHDLTNDYLISSKDKEVLFLDNIFLMTKTSSVKYPITEEGFKYLPQSSFSSRFWKSAILKSILKIVAIISGAVLVIANYSKIIDILNLT